MVDEIEHRVSCLGFTGIIDDKISEARNMCLSATLTAGLMAICG